MTETITNSCALIGRHIRHLTRTPEQLLSITLMPVVFVLVFGYLFGSAMKVPGDQSYQDYIMAGIFVQVVLGNMTLSSLGVISDLDNGLMDRFRSLPMSRSAVLIGRTTHDLILTVWCFILMSGIGYLIGWRVHEGVWSMLGGFGLMLLLGFATSWAGALLGLTLRSAEAVNALGAVIVMPLSFLSNAFIPLDGLPGWMRAIAEWNPVSPVVLACRKLFGNATPDTAGHAFPMQYPIPMAVILSVAMLAVVVPLTIRAYERAATKQ
ncbi:Daunorubicin/doxorubicin resistance ABC transporter permease protein DrrB [Streptomyces netropsis]|uniref:Transport permease protein n=1 Tax=Streptomyces syringium TaxID=76729 RepID=A0ABS4YAN7_9ACTN|nr:ABC transporter permease [Streptomyces syringium]MBP2405850.1 ABC transporter DrrB family efflux protein [Streptomyces syringium]SPE64237.1 Daunorubicin/doxorubicin resistance ABC transporter permease protein DrrB [Streptomyces netropsis]